MPRFYIGDEVAEKTHIVQRILPQSGLLVVSGITDFLDPKNALLVRSVASDQPGVYLDRFDAIWDLTLDDNNFGQKKLIMTKRDKSDWFDYPNFTSGMEKYGPFRNVTETKANLVATYHWLLKTNDDVAHQFKEKFID